MKTKKPTRPRRPRNETTSKRVRKQTSARVSTIAGRVLNALENEAGANKLVEVNMVSWAYLCAMRVGDLKAIAASCLSQDEVAGSALTQKTKVKRKAKR